MTTYATIDGDYYEVTLSPNGKSVTNRMPVTPEEAVPGLVSEYISGGMHFMQHDGTVTEQATDRAFMDKVVIPEYQRAEAAQGPETQNLAHLRQMLGDDPNLIVKVAGLEPAIAEKVWPDKVERYTFSDDPPELPARVPA